MSRRDAQPYYTLHENRSLLKEYNYATSSGAPWRERECCVGVKKVIWARCKMTPSPVYLQKASSSMMGDMGEKRMRAFPPVVRYSATNVSDTCHGLSPRRRSRARGGHCSGCPR